MGYKSFTDLETYIACRKLKMKIIEICNKEIPKEEKYALISQIKRSSRSVTANIAEGHGRYHYQENIQYCRQARGSLMETLEHLITAYDENYIKKEKFNELQTDYDTCLKLLNGYIGYLKKKKKLG